MAEGAADEAALAAAIRVARSGIAAACARAGRDPADVLLVAAAKSVPARRLRVAAALGVEDFGENYAADLAAKAERVPGAWHYLGKLQSGTVSRVADHADVVHSGEPGRALERLARRAAARGRVVRLLAQVDFVGRRQGVAPEDVAAFVREARGLSGTRWIGLMTLPPWTADPEGVRPYFARLRDLRDRLARGWPEVRHLSMGMSADYPVAIEEGATMVRIGTALFGERPGGASAGEP